MNKIGSWWLAKIDSNDREEVIHSFLANRTQSSNRAVGGKLFVTNQRCLFCPHLLDYFTGGETIEVELSQITEVGIKRAGGDTLGGGLRDRLKIVHGQKEELFVVNNLSDVVSIIRDSVSDHA